MRFEKVSYEVRFYCYCTINILTLTYFPLNVEYIKMKNDMRMTNSDIKYMAKRDIRFIIDI